MFKTWDTDSLEQQIMESYTLHHYSGMPPPSAWSGAVPPRSIERPGTLWCLQVTWQAWQGVLPEAPQLCARSKQLFLDVDRPRKDSSPASTLNHRLLHSITFRKQSPKAAFIPSFRSKFNFNTCLQTKGREQSLKKSELHSDCLKCYIQVVDYVDLL